ncbi:MAG: hypothetical protein GKR95_14865 [Gammaproteobacteria bacterium]|nr:hypothetical protein [Gammaproteobacteria bacterium]
MSTSTFFKFGKIPKYALGGIALLVALALWQYLDKHEFRIPTYVDLSVSDRTFLDHVKAYYDIGKGINEQDIEVIFSPHITDDIRLALPLWSTSYIRYDFNGDAEFTIRQLCLKSWIRARCWSGRDLYERLIALSQIEYHLDGNNAIRIRGVGLDPHFTINIDVSGNHSQLAELNSLALLLIALAIVLASFAALWGCARLARRLKIDPQSNLQMSLILILIVSFFFYLIGDLKLTALYRWFYTSDVFTYNQLMGETLKGNFGLEYTYGNQFGDHAYFIFLALLPLKWALGRYMVDFFILLTPAIHCIASVAVYFVLRPFQSPLTRLFLALSMLLGFRTVEVLYETVYGFHPDSLAGALAVIFGILFYRHSKEHTSKCYWWGVSVLLIFGLLKEEFLLLAVGFLIILAVLQRSLRFFLTAIVFTALSIFAFWFIGENQTTFNRGNGAIVGRLLSVFQHQSFYQGGLDLLQAYPREYVRIVSTYLAIYLILWGISGRLSPLGLALIAMALVKTLASFMANDYSFITWHNFPIIGFLSAAIIIQALNIERHKRGLMVASMLFGLSLVAFFPGQPRFYVNTLIQVNSRHIQPYLEDIESLQPFIEPDQVTAIASEPLYTAMAWRDDYRFSFFPRGITGYPHLIAGYVVVENAFFPDDQIQSCYSEMKRGAILHLAKTNH